MGDNSASAADRKVCVACQPADLIAAEQHGWRKSSFANEHCFRFPQPIASAEFASIRGLSFPHGEHFVGRKVKKMEAFYSLPFAVLEIPCLKLKRPSWFHKPSAMFVYSLVLVSYFLVCGGVIYDVIVEPPSIGSTVDEYGHSRPVAFMPYRVNGQYIMEGLASSFLFTLGGLGFVILDHTHNPNTPKLNRILLICVGFLCILVSFFTCWVFMRMKLPGYLQ